MHCRVYAELVHTKTIYTGITEDEDYNFQLFNPEIFGNFLKLFYEEANVDPADVEYVEACGTGKNFDSNFVKLIRVGLVDIHTNIHKLT